MTSPAFPIPSLLHRPIRRAFSGPTRHTPTGARLASQLRVTCLAAVLAVLPNVLPAQYSPDVKVRPPYMPGELLAGFTENTAIPDIPGKTLQDFAAAIGAVIKENQVPSPTPYLHLILNPGVGLGKAFRTAQTFDFGSPARWTLKYVEPNYLAFLAVVGGTPPGGHRLFNFSARAEVRTNEGAMIGGMVIPGEFARLVVFKVVAPALAAVGVEQPLANPVLQIFEGPNLILQNDNWTTLADWEKSLGQAAGPNPSHPLESMIVTYLDPGIYTAQVRGADGGTGVAILEMYLFDTFYVY